MKQTELVEAELSLHVKFRGCSFDRRRPLSLEHARRSSLARDSRARMHGRHCNCAERSAKPICEMRSTTSKRHLFDELYVRGRKRAGGRHAKDRHAFVDLTRRGRLWDEIPARHGSSSRQRRKRETMPFFSGQDLARCVTKCAGIGRLPENSEQVKWILRKAECGPQEA